MLLKEHVHCNEGDGSVIWDYNITVQPLKGIIQTSCLRNMFSRMSLNQTQIVLQYHSCKQKQSIGFVASVFINPWHLPQTNLWLFLRTSTPTLGQLQLGNFPRRWSIKPIKSLSNSERERVAPGDKGVARANVITDAHRHQGKRNRAFAINHELWFDFIAGVSTSACTERHSLNPSKVYEVEWNIQ